ncbi:uncharacterized protein [Nicotiana sylvestris]|uniref:uncharacterized protein n=1 Tax=Nicotiana sylvestris TaxID=4096 RepID=UPI00388CC7D3
MAPKKKAKIGQEDNATSGVANESLLDTAGEGSRPAITLPGSSIPEYTSPIPTLVEVTTIPPFDTPAPPPVPAFGSGISYGDLRGAIQMLTQLVASQAQRLNAAPSLSSQQLDTTRSRVNRFHQLDPPVFTGANPEEDPQDFTNEMHKTLRVMRATETEGVELATYRLKGVAYSWFELWEDSRQEGSPPARWSEFVDALIDHFVHAETRVAHATEFENLKQGSRSVWEYHMEFARLSKYAIHMLPTMEARGAGRGTAQSSSPAIATSLAPSPDRGAPAPVGCGATRGGAQSSGGPSRFYDMSGRQTAEASPDVVTGTLTVQSHDVYALIDPGSTLSYVTPFVAMEFGIEPD